MLKKRGKLPWALSARIFAIVFDALGALHQNGVDAGEVSAEHLIFASADKSAGSKTVRLVNAGFPRQLFDSSALGIGEPLHEGAMLSRSMPDDSSRPIVQGRESTPPHGDALDAAPQTEEDVFRLGLLFYRSLTGHEAASAGPPTRSGRGLPSLRQAAPEIPSMLADLMDSLVDPVPANRPKSCGSCLRPKRRRAWHASKKK